MNVLVIGGAGYIGSHVTYELCDQGYNVTVLDDLSTGFINNIDKRANFIQHSFADDSILSKALIDIDCVMHLAALKAAGDSMNEPIKYSKSNVINSINLINLCIESNVKSFIFSSSAAVYGNPTYLPLDEKHDLNPINYYGFTKLIIEQQLTWLNSLKGIKIGLLRYFNAAGYDINGRVKNKEKNPQNLLPIVMEVASGERSNMSVYGNDYETPDGSCLRDYIHVNDLALGHVKAIDALLHKSKIITNLATGNTYSVLEVIELAKKITGKNINYSIAERRAGDPAALYAKSNNELNFENKHSDLETIISSMWNVYKK